MLHHLICDTVSVLDVYMDCNVFILNRWSLLECFLPLRVLSFMCGVYSGSNSGTSVSVRCKEDNSSDVIPDFIIRQVKPVTFAKSFLPLPAKIC